MIKKLDVNIERKGLWMDGDVCYRQTEAWFGHTTQDLKMDIIYSREPPEKPWPCIIWICGGAWLQMDQHAWLPNFIELARAGFAIATVQYRLSNDALFPGALQDIKGAVRFLRKNAERYRINPDRIGVMGESAGGHLAGMMAVSNGMKEFDDGDFLEYSSDVQAACPWYMVSDLTAFPQFENAGLAPESRLIGALCAKEPDKAKAASPVSYVSSKTVPCLLLHGLEDKTVPHDQSVAFHDALEKAGVPVELYSIPGADHADRHFCQPPVMERIIDFFQSYLQNQEAIP